MKKSKLALLLGALLSLFVLAGCPGPAGSPEPQQETEYVTVTFDAGTGAVFSNNKQILTQRIEKGQSVSLPVPSISNENQAKIFDFSYYTVNDTDTVYVENTPFSEDTTLKAAYSVKAPTYIALNRNAECTELEITITHPSASVKFNINITDQTENDPDEARSISNAEKTTTVTELKAHHTYKVEVCTVYDNKTSSIIEKSVNMIPFYYVTIDANGYGKTLGGADSYSFQVDEGTSFSVDQELIPTVKEGFLTTYTFSHFINSETNEIINGSFTVNKDITLKAIYTLNPPTNIVLTKKDNGSSMDLTIKIEHPSDEVKFNITVTDISEESPEEERTYTNDLKERTRVVNNLPYFHTYSVSVKAVRYDDESTVITKSIIMDQYYTVTYNAGNKGNYNGSSSYSEQVKRGTAYTANKTPSIKSTYNNIYKFMHYTVNNTDDVFIDGTSITNDITLNAVYEVISPTAVTLTRATRDPVAFNILITHPSSSVKFNINISNKSNSEEEAIVSTQTSKSYSAKKLTFGDTYSVKVKTIYETDESSIVEEEIVMDQKASVPVLFLMYMDGDNNLNDPIFVDLNEAEYGLYKAGTSAANNVKIFSLWDGGPRHGTSGGKEYVNELADSSSRLLELGTESVPVFNTSGQLLVAGGTLSANTIDHSSEASWLASGEVNMSDRTTLKNFIEWVTTRYDADKIILQFSNHGGGPRSYVPNTATLENGEKIILKDKYGRRSMCWDDSSTDPDAFLKTSDLSWVFDQLGFGSSKKIEMIIEDVCLGGSIEEAYEIKEYANYFLASPNTIPGMGFDYTNLVKVLCENATSDSLSKTLGTKVIEQYSKDYKLTDDEWLAIINKKLDTNFTKMTEAYSALGTNATKIFRSLSLSSDVSTLSLIDLSKLGDVKTALDSVSQELLNNETTVFTKIFYDDENGLNTTSGNPVQRLPLLINTSFRPGSPIFYQGTFSWLYDIGYLSDSWFVYAQADEWTELTSCLNNLNTALNECVVACWRDGIVLNTYSTLSNNNFLNTTTNSNYYGLTISGETIKIEINGSQATVVSGYYPDWYEDLKFGMDCKWQDLLQAEPWKEDL